MSWSRIYRYCHGFNATELLYLLNAVDISKMFCTESSLKLNKNDFLKKINAIKSV